MSLRTIEQTMSDKIVERLRAEGDPNTTFLISSATVDSRTTRENAIADELALDAQITSRKVTTIPTDFTASDRAICISGTDQDMKDRGILDKIKFNADVRYIVIYDGGAFQDSFENFTELSNDIVSVGTTRDNTSQARVQVFKREKVFVQ